MNDETVEHRRSVLRHSFKVPQQYPGKKTNYKKEKIMHATKVKTDPNALVIKKMPL